jgi:hypothetical protein
VPFESSGGGGGGLRRRRVLLVNCYFDDLRQAIGRTRKIPQAMGPAYLAGGFSRELCDLRVYNEQYSGPLRDERLLGWPDMLVLTGLTSAFDRMRHMAAYARTKNPAVIVVAGGPGVRALPQYSARFFDYACAGDVEEIRDVIADAFGPPYVAEVMAPRLDLAYWLGAFGHAESSRNCNFRCSFCSLTGEGNGYRRYDLGSIRDQIIAGGKRKVLLFIDNNFYGNNRAFFLERLELLKEMRRAGYFQAWAALVTNDFFLKGENLALARESGCEGLFSGVESFDVECLRNFNKVQNTKMPQVEMIKRCLDAGILFLYGLILDVTTRRIADLRGEIEFVLGTPEIPLPSFLSLPIPLLGTPFFYDCLAKGLLLPDTRLRDLDSTTIALRPLDPIDEVAAFVRDIQALRGYKKRVLSHSLGFYRRYRGSLNARQLATAFANVPLLCSYSAATSSLRRFGMRGADRTHISSTEPLDPLYKPAFAVDARYADHFRPTMVTDGEGQLAEALREDLLRGRESPEVAGLGIVD